MPRVKKKTKKQLEDELAKASEDQKRREEQERLKTIEDKTTGTQRNRLDDELEARRKVEEAERLEEESSIVKRMKGERRQNLEYEQKKLEDQVSWQKFISCTSRPNVAYEAEITTYMTMVREERVKSMDDAMKRCAESEDIVGDLMELRCKAREQGDIARQDWCMHYAYLIRNLEIELIDEATAHLLQYIEKLEPQHNQQVTREWGGQADRIKVGFWGHLQSKGFRAKQIDMQKVAIALDLPKSIAVQSMGHCIGVRALYTTYDSVHGKDSSHMPIGGMIRIDLLSIPPQTKRVKQWTIRQIPALGQELMRLPYPNTEHSAASAAIAVQPCKIEYKVPSHVLVRKTHDKNPAVSWWDTTTEKWTNDNITEIAWDQETRKISFFTQKLAAFSITQERHLDLPYQWWCMRPVAPMMCELTIQAAQYELHFIITEAGLRLKGPELPELRGIMFGERLEGAAEAGREPRVRSPATLLAELRDCGLNLMPEDGDAEFLDGHNPKSPETQARAYSDLSEIAASHDIASSKHNKRLAQEKALVRIRENPLYEEFDPLDPDCDTDYQSLMFFPDKACFVQSLESQSPCNEALLPNNLTHASLYLCFEKLPDPGPTHAERLARLEVTCTNVRFIEAVRQTMDLMRLLCFV
mmetsp:Transcript_27306/g.62907  ORF Transcript_27306/g.62907 Transcript_27306/m.62907 type:complete len:641 (+) Transcript_27306:44-1966(+)